MNWRLFRWAWRLKSPLYIGTTPAGALNRCRLYVPARTLWAALTAELVRHERNADQATGEHYKAEGKALKTNYRFTYLYPARQVDGQWRAYLPAFEIGSGLVWRREDAPEEVPVRDRVFRGRILYTRPATAIDPWTDTAAEGSLRETECLQPRWRSESKRDEGPVALVGYVLVRNAEGFAQDDVGKISPIKSLLLGGDTRYGLGRLELDSIAAADPESGIFGCTVDVSQKNPIVQSSVVLAHASGEFGMAGALEVLKGWHAGEQDTISKTPLWVPGSGVTEGGAQAKFRIDELGFWQRVDGGVASEADQNEVTTAG